MGECTQPRPSVASRDTDIFERLQQQIDEKARQFRSRPITPLTFYQFEKSLKACLDSAGHAVLAGLAVACGLGFRMTGLLPAGRSVALIPPSSAAVAVMMHPPFGIRL